MVRSPFEGRRTLTILFNFEEFKQILTMNGYQAGKGGWVYIMSNPSRSVLYLGVTNNILRRVAEHKGGISKDGFTAQYHCTELIWQEPHTDIRDAIRREKQLKNWKRAWKLELIRKANPELLDLAREWFLSGNNSFETVSQET